MTDEAYHRNRVSKAEKDAAYQRKRADLHEQRAKALRELVGGYAKVANSLCTHWDRCEYCEHGNYALNMREKCELGRLNDMAAELGVTVGL